MKNLLNKKAIMIFFFFIISKIVSAKTFMDSIAYANHKHTPIEMWSGSGDDSIVCYKSTHRDIYLLVTGLIVIIAIVSIKLLIANKKANALLQKQNETIQEKNKNITDSINYASRIQSAILPTEKYIDKTLKRLKGEN